MNKALFFILIFTPIAIQAQVESDARLWTAISVKKKIEKFKFAFSEEFRLDENISHIDKVFSELEVEYELINDLEVSFAYRFSRENDYETNNYDLSNRISLGLSYKYKANKFSVGNRIKYQTENAAPIKNNPTYLRNKLSAEYEIDSFEPFISYEFFYQFNDEKVINKTRISFGGKYDINKNNAIKVFYIFENRFNVKRLKNSHIYGISYSVDI